MRAFTTTSSKLGFALLVIAAAAHSAARAQEPGEPRPADVERVYVPEAGFDRVLARHPRGVVVSEAELAELLRLAGLKPAPAPAPLAPPLLASVRSVRVTGQVTADGATAELTATADVDVLGAGDVPVGLPLAGLGVRRVLVDGQPARVVATGQGTVVLVAGAAPGAAEAVTRVITWELATRVQPGEERGAGVLALPVPVTAAGRLELSVPGDLEVVPSASQQGQPAQQQMSRGGQQRPDGAAASAGGVVWVAGTTGAQGQERTALQAAFGGAASSGGGPGEATQLTVSWRPRRAAATVTPYLIAEDRSAFLLRQGVVTLESAVNLEVYRAGRDRFQVELPAGFVVRALQVERDEVTYVQRGDRVEVALGAARTGSIALRLRAELTTGAGEGREAFALRPLRFPDADRAGGLVAVVQGEGASVAFEEVAGLERADQAELGPAPQQLSQNVSNAAALFGQGDALLRVYRHGATPARLALSVQPLAPRVELTVKAALDLREREVRALAAYRFRVLAGRVFTVRAEVPAGYSVESALVRDAAGREPQHQLKQAEHSVTVELQQGLRAGDELLVTLQAVREEPAGLAGKSLDLPRFTGAPATSVRGHLGLAPDEAFRLASSDLVGLTTIPADELPRAGLDVPGLVLGYRVEDAAYAGRVTLRPRETRASVLESVTFHRVFERTIETECVLDLEVDGAPVDALELLLPAGTGLLARIEGQDVHGDREVVGKAQDGRDRVRIPLQARFAGRRALKVRVDTTLPDVASADGGAQRVTLPQVSLADAFRERGTVAVFSSDATELAAEPQGLRQIEVTEVPALVGSTFEGRPLFAYTHVGTGWALGLSITRHAARDVLSAVVEKLHVESSAGPDGTSRHTATFDVRCLKTQFFALRLPAGARLWSVVVNGVGVKPASRDGLEIIPMPAPDPNRQQDALAVTYTLAGDAWGARSVQDLVAPELCFDAERAVPVLRTSWALALPGDYRVLRWSGNLAGAKAAGATPLGLALWQDLRQAGAGWLLLAALAGLVVAASPRLQSGLVSLLAGASGAGGAAGHGVAAVAGDRRVQKAAAVVALVALLGGLCVLGLRRNLERRAVVETKTSRVEQGDGAPYPPAAPGSAGGYADAVTQSEVDATTDGERQGRLAESDKEEAQNFAYEPPQPAEEAEAAPSAQREAEAEKPRADERAQLGRRLRDAVDAPDPAPPPPPPAPPAGAAPASPPMPSPAQRPPVPRPSRPVRRGGADAGPATGQATGGRPAGGVVGALGDVDEGDGMKGDAGAPMPDENAPAYGPADDTNEDRARERLDDAKAPDATPAPMDPAAPVEDLERKKAGEAVAGQPGETAPGKAEPPARVDVTATMIQSGEQVGLRSLLLSLPSVGDVARFERPGGQAVLGVEVVRESALVAACGLLAVLGLALGLTLPARARLAPAAVILIGVTLASTLPAVLLGPRAVPLLNAVGLGLLLSAPVHALSALTTAWDLRPLSRLAAAVRARRTGADRVA